MQALYLSAKELADLAVAGIPGSLRRLRLYAKKAGWQARRRDSRDGEAEYAVASMPQAVQAAIHAARKQGETPSTEALVTAVWAQAADDQRVAEESLKRAVTLKDAEQARVAAKLDILRAFDLWFHSLVPPMGLTPAGWLFESVYAAGTVAVAPETRAEYPTVSRATVWRWRQTLRDEGAAGLRGKYGGRAGSSSIDGQPRVRDFILASITDAPHLRMTSLLENLQTRFKGDLTVTLPSESALARWVRAWKAENEQQHLYNTNPDAWKSKRMSATGNASIAYTAPNQCWELDSTPADVMLVDGRHVLVGAIDVFTRRMKVLVAKSSKAEAVGLVMRRAVLDWGVPTAVLTDNGKDYVSRHVHQFLVDLRIEHRLCLPFMSEGKPHIERAFGTLTRDLHERLSGYIGHSVGERKVIEARKSFAERLRDPAEVIPVTMTAAELQAVIDQWLDVSYHQAPHGGLDGKSPMQVLGEWSGPPLRRIRDERALDMLLAPAPGDGFRVVGKKGIRVEGQWYLAPEHELVGLEGQRVQVRHDPLDMGKIAVYGGPEQTFLCIAVCAELLGIDRAEYAVTNKAMQKRLMAEGRARDMRRVREIQPGNVVHELLRQKGEADGHIVAFPAAEVDHDTPELRAALAAADAREAVAVVDDAYDDEVISAGQAAIADFVAERERRDAVEEPLDRFLRLQDRLKGGGQVDEAEARFLRHFEATPHYRGWQAAQEAIAEQNAP